MATAALASTPTIIDDAEAVTNWAGDTFSLEPDIKIAGSNSVACAMTANGNNDAYVTGSWDFTTDQHLRLWINISFIANLSATNPIQVFLADGSNTAYYAWAKASSYTGGWVQVVIYTGETPLSGTVTKSAITQIGIRFVCSSKPRSTPANAWFDQWAYGDGYTVTGGTNGDEISWTEIAAADKTNGYGIVSEVDGVFFFKGAIQIGDGTLTTYFKADTQLCRFTQEQVSSTLYGLSFIDSVSNATNIDISGGAIAGAIRYTIDASDANLATFLIDGLQTSFGGLIDFSSACTVQNSVFNNCLQIDPTTATFTKNTIQNSTDTGGALLWPGGSSVSSCTFSNNDKSVEITQTVNQTFVGMTFDDVGGKFDVHLNNGGTSIDVDKSGGSNPNSYTTTGGGVITFTASFSLTLEGIPSGVNVTIVDSTTRAELLHTTSTGTNIVYPHSGGQTVDILLMGFNFDPNLSDLFDYVLPNSDREIKFQMIDDPNAENPP